MGEGGGASTSEVEGKERRKREKWRRGEAPVRVRLRGKKEEKKRNGGRERKALYKKEKKRD
jgi:hypothetical protein